MLILSLLLQYLFIHLEQMSNFSLLDILGTFLNDWHHIWHWFSCTEEYCSDRLYTAIGRYLIRVHKILGWILQILEIHLYSSGFCTITSSRYFNFRDILWMPQKGSGRTISLISSTVNKEANGSASLRWLCLFIPLSYSDSLTMFFPSRCIGRRILNWFWFS